MVIWAVNISAKSATSAAGEHEVRPYAIYWLGCVEVPGHIDHNDALPALQQQQDPQHLGALVVQQIMLPAVLNQLWNNHRNLSSRVFVLELLDIV